MEINEDLVRGLLLKLDKGELAELVLTLGKQQGKLEPPSAETKARVEAGASQPSRVSRPRGSPDKAQPLSKARPVSLNGHESNGRTVTRDHRNSHDQNERLLDVICAQGHQDTIRLRSWRRNGCSNCANKAAANCPARRAWLQKAMQGHLEEYTLAVGELLREALPNPGDTMTTNVVQWLKVVGTREWSRILGGEVKAPDPKSVGRALSAISKSQEAMVREGISVSYTGRDSRHGAVWRITRLADPAKLSQGTERDVSCGP